MSEAELHVMQARMRGHLLRRGECLDSPQRVVLDTSGLLDFLGANRSEPKADATWFPSHPDFKPTPEVPEIPKALMKLPRTTITRAMFKELATARRARSGRASRNRHQVKQLITL
jgi:hypothetical protein